jgi:hypothetical protein
MTNLGDEYFETPAGHKIITTARVQDNGNS